MRRLLPVAFFLALCGCTKKPVPITGTPEPLKQIAANLPEAPKWQYGTDCTVLQKGKVVGACDSFEDFGNEKKYKFDRYPVMVTAETTFAFNGCQAAMTVTEKYQYSTYYTRVQTKTDQFSVGDLDPANLSVVGGSQNDAVELIISDHIGIAEAHTDNNGIDGGTEQNRTYTLSIPYATKDQAYQHAKIWREAIGACTAR